MSTLYYCEKLLIVCMWAITAVSLTNTKDLWRLDGLGKIFGGHATPWKEYSFMVSIRREGFFKCGGSFVTPKCILTAAHCLEGQYHTKNLDIYSQHPCVENQKVVQKVGQFFKPKSYDFENSLDMDVAILKLEAAAVNPTFRTVNLDFRWLHDGDILSVAGWGNTDHLNTKLSQCLLSVNVTVKSAHDCLLEMSRWHTISDNMFCARGKHAADACQGDSGGPILHNGRQVGIVSWGIGCGSGKPGIYTRLSSTNIKKFVTTTINTHC